MYSIIASKNFPIGWLVFRNFCGSQITSGTSTELWCKSVIDYRNHGTACLEMSCNLPIHVHSTVGNSAYMYPRSPLAITILIISMHSVCKNLTELIQSKMDC